MRAFVLVVACADAFSYTHHFEALPAPRGEPTTDERCMTVCYTDDARRVNRWLRDNAAGAAALGFDTETACAFPGRKPPAPGPHVLQLAAGDASIAEIAYILGYGDPANFRRAFRRWTGQSPGRFRRARRAGD